MSSLYRPSNGTEGEMFQADWCDQCAHRNTPTPCKILGRTMFYEVNDIGYPQEWISDDNGDNPRCTAFELDLSKRSG